jgi:hypothetical protein
VYLVVSRLEERIPRLVLMLLILVLRAVHLDGELHASGGIPQNEVNLNVTDMRVNIRIQAFCDETTKEFKLEYARLPESLNILNKAYQVSEDTLTLATLIKVPNHKQRCSSPCD